MKFVVRLQLFLWNVLFAFDSLDEGNKLFSQYATAGEGDFMMGVKPQRAEGPWTTNACFFRLITCAMHLWKYE